MSISSLFGSVGETTKFLLPFTVFPSTSTILLVAETTLFFSKVNVSVLSLKTTISSTCISPFDIFLDCTKNLTKVSCIGIEILPVKFASLSEIHCLYHQF